LANPNISAGNFRTIREFDRYQFSKVELLSIAFSPSSRTTSAGADTGSAFCANDDNGHNHSGR
jgi:hypothetical protein